MAASPRIPIADRKHVITAGNDERLRAGYQRGELLRRAGDLIVAAGRDQERHRQAVQFTTRERLPRATDTGGERAQVGARLLGERAERVPGRIGYVRARRRLERGRDRVRRQPCPFDKVNADPAEDG
jgi:hypothetical protein